MALSKSSVLHYWSSRYGLNARVGGRPVFTRNSSGVFTTQEGEVDSAIVNTPRFDWSTLNLPNGQSERRKLLTLELARTNLLSVSEDFSLWVVTGAVTVIGVQPDPFGGVAARFLNSTSAGSSVNLGSNAFSGNGTKSPSVYIRGGSAVASDISLFDTTAGVHRGIAHIAWAAGVPTVTASTGAPTIYPVEPLGGGWYRITFAAAGVIAANANKCYLYPGGQGGTGSVFAMAAQFDDGPFPTSYIKTVGSVTSRAADSCYWNFPPVPQGMLLYVRFVERGTILAGNTTRLVNIGHSSDIAPEVFIDVNAGLYRAFYNSAGGALVSAVGAAGAVGDTVELFFVLSPTGTIELVQSINGAAATTGGASAAQALSGAWADTRLWLNSLGAFGAGSAQFAEVKAVKYADVVGATAADRMAELRAFELGPNGDVL